jgi:hypothetical protein
MVRGLQRRVHARRQRYCYPLTITDSASRYLLVSDALTTTKEQYAFIVFERVFKDFGLPLSIRTDNGVPFASPNSFFGDGLAGRLFRDDSNSYIEPKDSDRNATCVE